WSIAPCSCASWSIAPCSCAAMSLAPCSCASTSHAPCSCAPLSDAPCSCASLSLAPCSCAQLSDAPSSCAPLKSPLRSSANQNTAERKSRPRKERLTVILSSFSGSTTKLWSVSTSRFENTLRGRPLTSSTAPQKSRACKDVQSSSSDQC